MIEERCTQTNWSSWLFSATTISITMLGFAFVCGLTSALMWERSNSSWQTHLDRAFNAGVALFGTVSELRSQPSRPVDSDIFVYQISQPKRITSENVTQLYFGVPSNAVYETSLTLHPPSAAITSAGDRIAVRVYSPQFRYSVASIQTTNNGLAFQFGELSRGIAKLCSDATMFVELDQDSWLRVNAPVIWSCSARPSDLRLPALLLAGLTLGILFSVANGFSQMLERLAADVRKAATSGSIEEIPERGANEVKSLANQTTNATEEISSLISSIQTEIVGAVDGAERIDNVIKQFDDISSGISAAVEEQGAATQEISRTVGQTAEVCASVATQVETVSLALQETNQVMGEVVAGTNRIDDQSSKVS
ncbi:hypothetical protein, partial [uncultured Maritalea sp.]|uniref:hypothetical protein n=1 Tax=uncultured Maritalea sp. TaxID=757249 RepID=UPI00261E2468